MFFVVQHPSLVCKESGRHCVVLKVFNSFRLVSGPPDVGVHIKIDLGEMRREDEKIEIEEE